MRPVSRSHRRLVTAAALLLTSAGLGSGLIGGGPLETPHELVRLMSFPRNVEQQRRLTSTAPIIIVAKLWWLCEAPCDGTIVEGGGRRFTQQAMYLREQTLKGTCPEIVPVAHEITHGGFMAKKGGLDQRAFVLGRKFVLFLREDRMDASVANGLYDCETECGTCQRSLFNGWVRLSDSSLLRYFPLEPSSGIYNFDEETLTAVTDAVKRGMAPASDGRNPERGGQAPGVVSPSAMPATH